MTIDEAYDLSEYVDERVKDLEHRTERVMSDKRCCIPHKEQDAITVKELYNIVSPYLDMQIGDSKTGEPLTCVDYLADSRCELYNYEEYDVYGITPKVNKEGKPYLAILVELKV